MNEETIIARDREKINGFICLNLLSPISAEKLIIDIDEAVADTCCTYQKGQKVMIQVLLIS